VQIFDRPLPGREFFEQVVRDNLDLGRPDRVQLIFDRVVLNVTASLRGSHQQSKWQCLPDAESLGSLCVRLA